MPMAKNTETLTLTQIVNGIKDNSFKFERLKSDLQLLAGLLDGAYVVKPNTDQDRETLEAEINRVSEYSISPFKPVEKVKHYHTVDTDMIKDLVNQIRETV